MLSVDQFEALFSPVHNVSMLSNYRWPNKVIPYQHSHDHSKKQQEYIEQALKMIESVSCVRFIKRTTEEDYIEITASKSVCDSF